MADVKQTVMLPADRHAAFVPTFDTDMAEDIMALWGWKYRKQAIPHTKMGGWVFYRGRHGEFIPEHESLRYVVGVMATLTYTMQRRVIEAATHKAKGVMVFRKNKHGRRRLVTEPLFPKIGQATRSMRRNGSAIENVPRAA